MIRLKELREQKNLSQADVANEINKSFQAYSHYEIGRRQPDYETLKKLADLFNVSIDYLLGYNDPHQQEFPYSPARTRFMEKLDKLNDDQLREIEQIADYVKSKKGKNEEAATTA